MRWFSQGYRICRRGLASRIFWQRLRWANIRLVAPQGIQHGGSAEGHGGPRRKEEIALRAQRCAASSVALDVLRSSSVLNAFFRSADIHATIEAPGCLHANGIRSNAIRLPSSGSRRAQEAARHGKWRPARLGLWAKIGKQVRRHCLHIVAPPGVEPARGALLPRLADGEGGSVFRNGEFELKRGSAVGDDDR
jgi:hypothetical protein